MQYDFVSYMSYDNVSWFCIICHDNVSWSFVLQFYNILYFDIRDHLICSVSYYKISKRIALNKIYLIIYSSLLFSLRFTVSEPICSWVNWDNEDKVSCLMNDRTCNLKCPQLVSNRRPFRYQPTPTCTTTELHSPHSTSSAVA